MASSSLLALFDDIATLLDDVAAMSKLAAKKTTGVLADDLALNAGQVSGVRAERELPVVWAVAKGSFKNKLILVPAALLISAFVPWAITLLLMLGGAFLCYEGFEKLAHKFLHNKEDDQIEHAEKLKALSDPKVDLVAFEQQKIKGAIRTDFILSAEIIVISLGAVQEATFAVQIAVVSLLAVAITVGVYGIVAGIVKMDDAGLYLVKNASADAWGSVKRVVGNGLLSFAPYLMKILSVVGTAAMFMVGGGILMHGLPVLHEMPDLAAEAVYALPVVGAVFSTLVPTLVNAIAGVIAGALVLVGVNISTGVYSKVKGA